MFRLQSRRVGLAAGISSLMLAMPAALLLLWCVGLLNADNAAGWVTAVATSGLILVALLALWPAARQARLASIAAQHAAQASAESHRPYLTVMTRVGIGGFVYLDLMNYGNRAAIDVRAVCSCPPIERPKNTKRPCEPFGDVSYLAPSERRSVMYATGNDTEQWPSILGISLSYGDEQGAVHKAQVTHNLEALQLILSNPENKTTPQTLIKKSANELRSIVNEALRQQAPDRRVRLGIASLGSLLAQFAEFFRRRRD